MKVNIIGAGISGLNTAISLKKHNDSIDVTIYEKNKTIGYNSEGRCCGEAHTVEFEWKKWIPEKLSYFNKITCGEINVGPKTYNYILEPGIGYILNKPEFICQLFREATKLGVNIRTNEKIKSIKELKGRYIVDASGYPSTLKKELGLKNGSAGICYQQTIQNSNLFKSDTIKLYYDANLGYYYIFPRDPSLKEINLGIGFYNKVNYNLKKLLENFKKIHKINGKINYETAGFIPRGLQRPLIYKNILFVGDNGVGTFPLNGKGIHHALLSGDAAGKCIAEEKIKKYPKMMYDLFIKWDLVAKTFIKTNSILRKINTDLVFKSLNSFNNFTDSFGLTNKSVKKIENK